LIHPPPPSNPQGATTARTCNKSRQSHNHPILRRPETSLARPQRAKSTGAIILPPKEGKNDSLAARHSSKERKERNQPRRRQARIALDHLFLLTYPPSSSQACQIVGCVSVRWGNPALSRCRPSVFSRSPAGWFSTSNNDPRTAHPHTHHHHHQHTEAIATTTQRSPISLAFLSLSPFFARAVPAIHLAAPYQLYRPARRLFASTTYRIIVLRSVLPAARPHCRPCPSRRPRPRPHFWEFFFFFFFPSLRPRQLCCPALRAAHDWELPGPWRRPRIEILTMAATA
jgi:hypothetical protein